MHASAIRIAAAIVAVLLASLAAGHRTPTKAQLGLVAPEQASGWQQRPLTLARRHMVAAANPLAAEAGQAILRQGGTAADAAIAVQLVLGLVEPQSSGLGGGAFMLHWDARTRALASYDGREQAPAAAKPNRFMAGKRPLAFNKAVKSSLSIGVPGTVRLLEHVHQRHGRRPWASLFEPAISLAERGFTVSPRLHGLLRETPAKSFDAAARRYFFDPSGKPWPVGHRLVNPAYAETLRRLAQGGTAAFYAGAIAEAVVRAAAPSLDDPAAATLDERAHLTLADLAGYRVIERPPVCVPYRGLRVCSMGPPSSGGHALGQALAILEGFELGSHPEAAMSPVALHVVADASRLAFADRNWYLADPDFVAIPTGLLDPGYLAERRSLISLDRPLRRLYPGTPPRVKPQALGADGTIEAAGTSHISIVDADGNALAMTTTIEAGFGSGRWAAGFLLNNELTDFSFRPVARGGRPIANRVEGGKRPRSSMSPTIVLDASGRPMIVTGSAGGSRIIGYVLKTLVGVIDWKLDAASALALPNFGSRGGPFELEHPVVGGFAGLRHRAGPLRLISAAIALSPYEPTIAFDTLTSGTQLIVRRPDGTLEGAADPRREGRAFGD